MSLLEPSRARQEGPGTQARASRPAPAAPDRPKPAVRKAVRLLALSLVAMIGSSAAETTRKLTREYDLKAAFLFNFAQFVEWPPESFPASNTPITIGILGEDPFGTSLDEIVANETVRNRSLVVRRYHDVTEIRDCHILFISRSENAELEKLRAHLDKKSILTVGETEEFGTRFGIIRLVMADNRMRLRINVEAAKSARLTISSKLLRLAEIVGAGSDR